MTMPRRGMVLAAGRGQRMRTLSDAIPKPLIELGGRSMLDRMLDRLNELESVVVNAWHLADQIAEALERRHAAPPVQLSREDTLLNTGGGVKHALPLLGKHAFIVANGDVLLQERREPALARLAQSWDDGSMDALLLLVARDRAGGFRGSGDFFMDEAGRLTRRGDAMSAPYVYASLQLVHPRLFKDAPDGAFSFNLLWDRAMAWGRLFGAVLDGDWFTVDTPENIDAAEAWLRART